MCHANIGLTPSKLVALVVAALLAAPAAAQFTSGSDGSLGALDVTENTEVVLPADGILNYTTVSVAVGATLTFKRNLLNTPVYLLATGDINIGGVVSVTGTRGSTSPTDVPGLGGPGGFDGGQSGESGVRFPGDGFGPGAGTYDSGGNFGGDGAFATKTSTAERDGRTYGTSLLLSLIGGSGGSGAFGVTGGGGGGAILLASSTRIAVSGSIHARGSRDSAGTVCFCCCGSGGAVRLVAPVVAGDGIIDVTNPNDNSSGAGRIRVDTLDRAAMSFDAEPDEAITFGRFMIVFPSNLGSLRIVEVAGSVIPEAAASEVLVEMMDGADPNVNVIVEGTGFTGMVDIEVVLTPEEGSRVIVPAVLDMTEDPKQVTVPVVMPTNTVTKINAWRL